MAEEVNKNSIIFPIAIEAEGVVTNDPADIFVTLNIPRKIFFTCQRAVLSLCRRNVPKWTTMNFVSRLMNFDPGSARELETHFIIMLECKRRKEKRKRFRKIIPCKERLEIAKFRQLFEMYERKREEIERDRERGTERASINMYTMFIMKWTE